MKRFSQAVPSLRAVLGLVVIALQVLGALHFSLVRHGYSAALGGVVHVHASARAEQSPPKSAARRAAVLANEAPSCGSELCPVGNAQASPAARIELLVSGAIAFGEARLLSERAASKSESLRVFLSAPKTSPPV